MGLFRQSLIAVLFFATVVMPVRPASAQTQQQVDWCMGIGNPTPDIKIDACTAVIQSGSRSGKNLAFAFNNRGNAYGDKGQYERSMVDFDRSIELDPNQGTAFRNRCIFRAKAGRDLSEAVSDCTEAFRMGYKPTIDPIGWRGVAYLRLDQLERAIADFDEVLRIDPKEEDSLYLRGLAKLRKSDRLGGDADIAAAKLIKSNVADKWTGYGVR